MVFEQVQADLEAQGTRSGRISAGCGYRGAAPPDRVWIVAHTGGDGCGGYPAVAEFDHRGMKKGWRAGMTLTHYLAVGFLPTPTAMAGKGGLRTGSETF